MKKYRAVFIFHLGLDSTNKEDANKEVDDLLYEGETFDIRDFEDIKVEEYK